MKYYITFIVLILIYIFVLYNEYNWNYKINQIKKTYDIQKQEIHDMYTLKQNNIEKELLSINLYSRESKIPKIIWTYWDSNDIPDFINICIKTWKKHNPDYKIIILLPNNLHIYTNINIKKIKWNDSPARESDIIKLTILEKFGGVWSDASIIFTKPLNINNNFDFVGYYIEKFTSNEKFPVIESWFFASVPKGNFISNWKKAFFKLNHFNNLNVYHCIDYYKNLGVDFQKIDNLDYLFIHVAAQYVLQKTMSLDEIKNTLYLEKVEDGPFKYVYNNNWDSELGINDLIEGNNLHDIIKIRSLERRTLNFYKFINILAERD